MFLGFANFYRRFIRNISKIATPLTLMLQTTDNEALNTQITKNENNQDASTSAGSVNSGGTNSRVSESIENL